jgi:hypothetical protein
MLVKLFRQTEKRFNGGVMRVEQLLSWKRREGMW